MELDSPAGLVAFTYLLVHQFLTCTSNGSNVAEIHRKTVHFSFFLHQGLVYQSVFSGVLPYCRSLPKKVVEKNFPRLFRQPIILHSLYELVRK